jgi:hypothetical protein
MKTFGGVEVYSTILDLGTRWGEWSASRPGRFTPGKRVPRYPLDRRVGGPQGWSGRCEVEKNLLPLLGIEPRLSSP